MITIELIEDAYRKLKGSIYSDKTLAHLRSDVVYYEANIDNNLQNLLEKISGDEKEWDEFIYNILNSVNLLTFPKESRSNYEDDNENKVISNVIDDVPIITKYNNYIDLDVNGHILGVLWILLVGYKIDNSLSNNCYANRLSKHLILHDERTTASPNLFEPYYYKYTKWREDALAVAEKSLKKDESIIIMMMDLHRYFYNIDLGDEASFNSYISNYVDDDITQNRLTDFIYRLCCEFSSICGLDNIALPIGFLPSNIISNYYLSDFDDNSTNINALHYGRYVDDFIYVIKVPDEKKIDIKSSDNINQAIERIATTCLLDNQLLLESKEKLRICGYKYLEIEKNKQRFFYLDNTSGLQIIEKIRDDIRINGSEFRLFPENPATNDYLNIWSVDRSDTPNKMRGVNRINVDKYSLSKLLSRNIVIAKYLNDDDNADTLELITNSLSNTGIINNYTLWESLLQNCIVSRDICSIKSVFDVIVNSILCLDEDSNKKKEYKYLNNPRILSVKDSLFLNLLSSSIRSFSCIWGEQADDTIKHLYDSIPNLRNLCTLSAKDWVLKKTCIRMRKGFCNTRMIRLEGNSVQIEECMKAHRPVSKGKLVNILDIKCTLNTEKDVRYDRNRTKFKPYIEKPFNILFSKLLGEIRKGNDISTIDKQLLSYLSKQYKLNFRTGGDLIDDSINFYYDNYFDDYIIRINSDKSFDLSNVKIALANVRMESDDIEAIFCGLKGDKSKRYSEIQHIMNQAIKEKADVLVFPEAYVPIEYLSLIQAKAAKEQMLVICGVEHIIRKDKVYNITATLIPFEKKYKDESNYSVKYIIPFFHQKQYFSEREKELLKKYNYEQAKPNQSPLIIFNDMAFSSLCCYELSSLDLRKKYLGYAEVLFAIEWNKDTNYFSSIVESYSRDAYCYCVQVNMSEYGDTRIVRPTREFCKDIVRIKGGSNAIVITDTINLNNLKFHREGYRDGEADIFKPLPAGWGKRI